MRQLAFSLALVLVAVGCGSSSEDPKSETGGSAGASGSGTGGSGTGGSGTGGSAGTGGTGTGGAGGTIPGGESFELSIEMPGITTGKEDTKCVIKRLSNEHPIHVNSIHNVLSTASHHMIVYRTNDTVEKTTPFPCTPFVDTLDPSKGAPLVVSQKHDDLLTLPEGVAFTLAAHQMIRIEMHYINTTTTTQDVVGTAQFNTIGDAEFTDEADFLFMGNPDINVPPRSSATLGPIYFPLPAAYKDVHFFAITGHEHAFGTNVTVDTAASESGAGQPVYNVPGWSWSEPATVMHDPPFQIPDGGGFRFTCEWNNTSNRTLGFGESATAEMCFFWAYYYPSKGAKVCIKTEQFGGGIAACCPDDTNFLCGLISQYLN